jgi:hypothetical protein
MKLGTKIVRSSALLIVVLVLSGAIMPGFASAAPIGLDLERFRIISIGFAAEQRCRFLPENAFDELALHAAFAETAAVRANGADAVRDVRRYAKPPAKCEATSHSLVEAALSTGRDFENAFATASTRNTATNRISARQQRIRQRQRDSEMKTSAFFSVRKELKATVSGANNSFIDRFQTQLQAYYVDHRCHFLKQRMAHKFWKLINKGHSKLSSNVSKSTLAQVNRSAKFAARKASCNASAHRFVSANMRALANDIAVH